MVYVLTKSHRGWSPGTQVNIVQDLGTEAVVETVVSRVQLTVPKEWLVERRQRTEQVNSPNRKQRRANDPDVAAKKIIREAGL